MKGFDVGVKNEVVVVAMEGVGSGVGKAVWE